jgi:hypothetical protein
MLTIIKVLLYSNLVFFFWFQVIHPRITGPKKPGLPKGFDPTNKDHRCEDFAFESLGGAVGKDDPHYESLIKYLCGEYYTKKKKKNVQKTLMIRSLKS